jgi:hypothetical protein
LGEPIDLNFVDIDVRSFEPLVARDGYLDADLYQALHLDQVPYFANSQYESFYQTAIRYGVSLESQGRNEEALKIYERLVRVPEQTHVGALKRYVELALRMPGVDINQVLDYLNDRLADVKAMFSTKFPELLNSRTIAGLNMNQLQETTWDFVTELFLQKGRVLHRRNLPGDLEAAQLSLERARYFDLEPTEATIHKIMEVFVEATLRSYLWWIYFEKKERSLDKEDHVAEIQKMKDRVHQEFRQLVNLRDQWPTAPSGTAVDWSADRLRTLRQRQYNSVLNPLKFIEVTKFEIFMKDNLAIRQNAPEADKIRGLWDPAKRTDEQGNGDAAYSLFDVDYSEWISQSQGDPHLLDKGLIMGLWAFDRMIEAMAEGDEDKAQGYRKDVDAAKKTLRNAFGSNDYANLYLTAIELMEAELRRMKPEDIRKRFQELMKEMTEAYDPREEKAQIKKEIKEKKEELKAVDP